MDRKDYDKVWRARKLFPIRAHLKGAAKTEYEKLIAEIGEQPPEKEHGVSVGPISPISVDDFKKLKPKDVLDYLASWKQQEEGPVIEPSYGGLGRDLTEIVKESPKEFSQLAMEFWNKGLRPAYIYHLLQGLREASNSAKEFPWEEVMKLLEKLFLGADLPKVSREDFFDAGWSEVKSAGINLVEEGLNRSSIVPELGDRVWKILERALQDPSPTLEEEDKLIGAEGRGGWDPAMVALNTARGRAMHAAIEYALWCSRNSKKPYLAKEVRAVFEDKLEPKKEPTRAIRSVYGQYLPNIVYLDREWFLKNKDRIFGGTPELGRTAWDTFIFFNAVYKDVYPLIKDKYLDAINSVIITYKRGGARDPEWALAEHVMILYLNDLEDLKDGSLVDIFFKKVPPKLKAHAIGFVGRDLKKFDPDRMVEVRERLKKLWEKRIKESDSSEELEQFGWWFSNSPFSREDSIKLLLGTLEKTKGVVEPTYLGVVDALLGYAEEFPLQVIEGLNLIVTAGKDPYPEYRLEDVKNILEVVERSKNDEALKIAGKLRDHLNRMGHYEYFKD